MLEKTYVMVLVNVVNSFYFDTLAQTLLPLLDDEPEVIFCLLSCEPVFAVIWVWPGSSQ